MSILIVSVYVLLGALVWALSAGLSMWLTGRGLLTPGSVIERIAQFLVRTVDWACAVFVIAAGVWLVSPRKRKQMGPIKAQLRVLQETRAAERKLDVNLRKAVREAGAAAAGRETILIAKGDNEVEIIKTEARSATLEEAHAEWEARHGR